MPAESGALVGELAHERRHAAEPWIVNLTGRDVRLLRRAKRSHRGGHAIEARLQIAVAVEQRVETLLNVPDDVTRADADQEEQREQREAECALLHPRQDSRNKTGSGLRVPI